MRRNVRLGRFTLVRPLGVGGMAELYLARADGIEGFSMLCAVKRILPHRAQNERFVRMFLNEARLVAALNHPNIAHVHDIGREGREYFFAMEFVHGQDLRRIIRAAPARRMQLENALHVAIGVCAGLHHAHEASSSNGKSLGIVHRDVSPSNVIVSYQGSVKLVDFGVAKAASIESETREGTIKGKYGYMSPEQCLNEPLDRRSDIFNVGILLWEMTTGRRLYKASGELQTLHRVVYADALAPSRLIPSYPPELEQIVMRALARDRDRRYQTAQELQLDLEAFARERKLNVSAVSMAREMSDLFREQIHAWHAAEQAGRSLAEHLAELSDESSLSSSDHDDLDGLIGDLDTQVPIAEITRSLGKPHKAPTHAEIVVPPSPIASLPAGRRRSRVVPLLAAVLACGAVAGGWYVGSMKREHVPEQSAATVVEQDAALVAPVDSPVDASADVELDVVAVEVVTTVDAGVRPHEPPRKKPTHSRPPPERHVTPPRPETPTVTADASVPLPPAPPPPPPPSGPKPGTVDPAAIRATVRAHVSQIEACVARARMLDRDIKGRVVVEVRLSGTGAVNRASVKSSTGATEALQDCIVGVVKQWTFAAPAGAAPGAFTYPFAF